jgi:hypothetical protein
MTEQTLANTETTEVSDQTQTQAEKTYSQKELDDMMARTRASVQKKIMSKYEDLGDPDELREIVSNYRKSQQDQQVKRGEFDKVLQDLAAKKDAEIQKRDRMIEEFKVNSPIIDAAARHRSINPDQVKALVRSNVRLNADGEVEVVDKDGKVRYDDNGRLLTVDNFVQEFLQQNPHFIQPTPSTTATRSNVNGITQPIDLSKLDMRNPEHRKIYAESRKGR